MEVQKKRKVENETDNASTALQGLKPSHIFDCGRMLFFPPLERAEILITDDSQTPYFSLLSELEIELRLGKHKTFVEWKNQSNPTLQELQKRFRDEVKKDVRAWKREEIEMILKIFRTCYEAWLRICGSTECFPSHWCFLKARGLGEGTALYTIGNCIVIPVYVIDHYLIHWTERIDVLELLLHEFFHILSRNNPKMKLLLYSMIGFYALDAPLQIPPSISKITNPDCPNLGFAITLNSGVRAVLIEYTLARARHQGKEICDYISTGLFAIRSNNGIYELVEPPLLDNLQWDHSTQDKWGFFDQVGRVTQYIAHPEEVLADCLTLIGLCFLGISLPKLTPENWQFLQKIQNAIHPQELKCTIPSRPKRISKKNQTQSLWK